MPPLRKKECGGERREGEGGGKRERKFIRLSRVYACKRPIFPAPQGPLGTTVSDPREETGTVPEHFQGWSKNQKSKRKKGGGLEDDSVASTS